MNILSDVFLSFLLGIFFGYFSTSLELTIVYIFVFEFFVFITTFFLSSKYTLEIRFIINCSYFLGWLLIKYVYFQEHGFWFYSCKPNCKHRF